MSRCFRGNRGFCCPRHRSKAVVHSEDHGFDLACWQVRSMTTAVNLRLYNSSTSANARIRETCRPIGDQRRYCGVCRRCNSEKLKMIGAIPHHSSRVVTALSARYENFDEAVRFEAQDPYAE